MDNLQLKIKKHQKILAEYIQQLAKNYNSALGNDMTYQAVIDTQNNHFQFVKMGWYGYEFIFSVLIHLDINPTTGNIWIQQNNTEIQLDLELEKFGNIPKQHLVLGFRPEFMRIHSDFAIA